MKEYKYKINGNTYKVAVGDIDNNIAEVEVNGVPYKVELDEAKKPVKIVATPRPSAAPRTADGAKVIAKPTSTGGAGYKVTAPLPGTVLSINVKVGDTVKAADTVAVLEAMKMENAIHAGRDGVVKTIDTNTGDALPEGGLILTIE